MIPPLPLWGGAMREDLLGSARRFFKTPGTCGSCWLVCIYIAIKSDKIDGPVHQSWGGGAGSKRSVCTPAVGAAASPGAAAAQCTALLTDP